MSETAIKLENVEKSFRIFKEKKQSIFHLITSFNDTTRGYEKLKILDNVSFEVKKGEMVGIIGRNGSGKTTLLKLIAGVLHPDKGTIVRNGEITPFLEIGTGFNGELSARENIILYGIILGFSKGVIKNKVEDIIKYAELEKFIDTKLKHFSSGMYARLAFATAVQVDPEIMLVDEVLSVGDAAFQKKSFDTFKEFIKRKKTILFISHDLNSVRNLCNSVMVIDKGKIVCNDKPDIAIEYYQNLLNQAA
ncbi:MAG TPA: ABC transporter ATP-binding protein [Verrucomicrobiae bacterium]|nr:ABC transporter ATP-binding protein [Verrucomicrobiae bacterium]